MKDNDCFYKSILFFLEVKSQFYYCLCLKILIKTSVLDNKLKLF